MNVESYQGITEGCRRWGSAGRIRHTFDPLETSLSLKSNTVIDAWKGIVECVGRVIIEELDDPTRPLKPTRDDVSINARLGVATRRLQLSDNRPRKFADLIKHHSTLADSLRELRSDVGPLRDRRNKIINTQSIDHPRSTVLSADAIATFPHRAQSRLLFHLDRAANVGALTSVKIAPAQGGSF